MFRCVINLDQSIDRWKAIKPQFDALGLDVVRISAVLGKALSETERQKHLRPMEFGYLYPLTPNEIGCFLSHRKAWDAFLASGEDWGVFFEDDMRLSPDIKPFVESDIWIPSGVDVLKFYAPGTDILIDRKTLKTPLGVNLVRQIRPISFGTVCYALSRKAAQAAFEQSHTFCSPIDYFMFSPWFSFSRQFPAWRLGIQTIQLTDMPSLIGLRKRKGGLHENRSARWNPLRWLKQIRISSEKLGKVRYLVKDGKF